jgi:hypothetical protein
MGDVMSGVPGLPGNWDEPDSGLLNELERHGAGAADPVMIRFSGGTPAERTRAAVRAALRMLLANGLVTAVPMEDWPAYVILDPPGPTWTQPAPEAT